MATLRLSNIDEYVSGNVRTDAIEIVRGEQKRFVANTGVNLTNYSFTTQVTYFNASVTYSGTAPNETVAITGFSQVINTTDSDFTNIVVVTNASNGDVEFRIPQNLVPSEINVPIDSASPLVAVVTTTINRDTTASFPIIDKESVAIIVRYAPV